MKKHRTDDGFFRLQHEDLAAALALRPPGSKKLLCGEQLRVYLALADQTVGFGKARDVVSLSQIAEQAGGLRRDRVLRALKGLAKLKLYGQTGGDGQDLIRWVTWPPPVPATGNSKESSSVPDTGNRTVPNAVPKAVPALGTHQEIEETKKERKRRAAAPPDPRVRVFLDWFVTEYQSTLGRPYIVTGRKYGATVKRLLQSLSQDELQAATRAMLADSWAKDKADIGLLASKINSWRGQQKRPDAERYADGF